MSSSHRPLEAVGDTYVLAVAAVTARHVQEHVRLLVCTIEGAELHALLGSQLATIVM
jgi:hypothetical protein